MRTSAIISAIFLASGSMADYYSPANEWSSPMSTDKPVTAAMAAATETWAPWSSSTPVNKYTTTAMAVETQTSASWPSSSSKPGTVLVQVVQVSNRNGSSLRYYPEHVQAPPGSWVQFQFYPKNHTVTQSTFDHPCVSINSVMSNVTGIKSGFVPVAANATQIPVFSVLVNDTNPIWLYCGQVGHCQQGMAMVINEKAGSNKTLAAYKAAAAKISSSVSSTIPLKTSSMMMMSTSIPTSVPTTSMPTSVPTTTKASPAAFTGAANRDAVASSGLVGLLFAGLVFVL